MEDLQEIARLIADVPAVATLLESVVAWLPVGLAVVDATGAWVAANSAFKKILGGIPTPGESLLKDKRAEALGATDMIRQSLQGKDVQKAAMWLDTRSSSLHGEGPAKSLLSFSSHPVFDANRSVRFAILFCRDETLEGNAREEALRGRQRLREAEEWMGLAIHRVGLGTWEYFPNSGAMLCSKQCKSMFGLAPDDISSLASILEHVHPQDRESVRQRISVASIPETAGARSGALFDLDCRIVNAGQALKWVLLRGRMISDSQGAPRVVGIAMDVTGRKDLEEANSMLSAIVEHSYDAIMTRNLQGIITYCNPAAERLLGYAKKDLLGSHVSLWVPQDRLSELNEHLIRIHQGETLSGLNTERVDRQGKRLRVYLTVAPIFDSTAAVVGASIIAKDISDQTELEERLRQAQKMESVGQLAGGVAHDFNNLLTVINGFAMLTLARLEPGDPLWRGIKNIEEAGNRAAALTQQLLTFSRKESSEAQVVDLNNTVSGITSLLQHLIKDQIELATHLDSDLPMVHANPDQIGQVLLNLAINARDAMPDGGKLTIETKPAMLENRYAGSVMEVKSGPYAELKVMDTGCGIDAQAMPHIFEPFFTTKKGSKGTGLGLATVYGIVKQSHGYIAVDSAKGVGTTFRVYLPLAADSLPEEQKSPALNLTGKDRILLVEDNARLREYAAEVLEGFGYAIFRAEDGKEAMRIVTAQHYKLDLVITDVSLPGMSGTELVEVLTQQGLRAPVIFMSGSPEDVIADGGQLLDGATFLAKPFTPEELGGQVYELLSRNKRRNDPAG